MTTASRLAASVSMPKRGQLLALAATTTPAFVDLTAAITVDSKSERTFCNRYLTLQADGADMYLALSKTATGTIDPATASAVDGTSKAPTPDVDGEECVLLPSGQSMEILMEGPTTQYPYLTFRTSSSTGTLRVWPSSPQEMKERR